MGQLINRIVYNKNYKAGKIDRINEENIFVDFDGTLKMFNIINAFQSGTLTTEDEYVKKMIESMYNITLPEQVVPNFKLSNDPNVIIPVLFCNIAWMKYYVGRKDDHPINGGEFVRRTGIAHEDRNFEKIIMEGEVPEDDHEVCLGFYDCRPTEGGMTQQTHIEKILGCEDHRTNNFVDGVLVIWCATPANGTCRVVGWYKNATVYRHQQEIEIVNIDSSLRYKFYNVVCDYENATLLPEDIRYQEKWRVPRHTLKNPVKFGLGQASKWYAREPEAKEFVSRMIKNIKYYPYGNIVSVKKKGTLEPKV